MSPMLLNSGKSEIMNMFISNWCDYNDDIVSGNLSMKPSICGKLLDVVIDNHMDVCTHVDKTPHYFCCNNATIVKNTTAIRSINNKHYSSS